jgi:hypothetical protein
MRFRTGVIVGLAVGYYYGTKASPEQAARIQDWVDRVRDSNAYQRLIGKLAEGWSEGTSTARRVIEDTAFGGSGGRADLRAVAGEPTLN